MKLTRTHTLLSLIIFFSFVYRLIIVFNSNLTLFSDDAIYAQIARFWIKGDFSKVFHPTWPPLYPFLSAIFYLFVKNWELSLQLVSVTSGVLIIIPIYFLIKNSLTKTHALIFCTLFTFFEPMLGVSLLPLSDMLATLFTICGITLAYLGIRFKKTEYLYTTGFVFGLNYLTRPEGFLFFVITLLFYIGFIILNKKLWNTKTIVNVFVSVLIFLITISPYAIVSKIQSGSWSLSKKAAAQIKQGHAFTINKNGLTWSDEVVSAKNPNYKSEYFEGGADLIFNSGFLLTLFNEKIHKWTNVFYKLFPRWSILPIIIGLVSLFRKNKFWELLYVAFVLFVNATITIFVTSFADPRYLMWSVPLLFLFFYHGMDTFLSIFIDKKPKNKIVMAVIPMLLIVTFPSFQLKNILSPKKYGALFKQQNEAVEIKIVTDWIRTNSKDKIYKVMSRHEGFEFYLDGETVYIPQNKTYEEVLEYGKKYGAKYLIIWAREIGNEKELIKLIDIRANSNKPILFYYPQEQPKIVVYSIE